jgi:nifR3 family TIM-barrel protein
MRVGWSLSQLTSIPLALKFQDLGVQGFALHGRTAQQGFNGNADWDWIAEMKAALRMPVTGNGDVKTPEQAEEMLRVTGCDGVMIGRAAIGNPWILREVGHYLRTGEHLPPPTLRERVDTALEHVRSLAEVYGEENAVRHLRGQVPIYIKGFRGANHAREQIVRVLQIDEVERILMSVIEENANEHV